MHICQQGIDGNFRSSEVSGMHLTNGRFKYLVRLKPNKRILENNHFHKFFQEYFRVPGVFKTPWFQREHRLQITIKKGGIDQIFGNYFCVFCVSITDW